MNAPRWYPTNTTLANGDVLVISGEISDDLPNVLPQVWQDATGTWRNLSSAQRALPTYPWMFLAPDGRVFDAGPQSLTTYLDTRSSGTWTDVARRVDSGREFGTATMYLPGRVLVLGGVGPTAALATAEVIDLNAAGPTWRRVGSMTSGRSNPNATLLPDGTVLVTGGHSGNSKEDPSRAVLAAELWDPVTEQFSLLAPASVYRGYHSTAVLLPDGRVLSAGGTEAGQANAQLFSPPYLSAGPRPIITSAPGHVGYGETFLVETPDASAITQVTFIRLTAVTHAFNQNQRFNRLAFATVGGQLSVTAPAVANEAPPGHYMLFILDSSGVPSVAAIVQLGGTLVTHPPPPPSPTVLFSDAFDRSVPPDGGLGPSWSLVAGAWFTDGRAQSDRDGGNLAIERVASCADCTVQASLLGFGVPETGLTLRSPGVSSTDRYDVILQGSGNLQIRRVRGGVVTVLAQGPSGLSDLRDHPATVSLSASGAGPVALIASVNGAVRVQATDASPAALTASGYAGLWTSHAGVVFDNFLLTSSAEPPPPEPADLAMPADLATPPDLSTPPDMAVQPDLSAPPAGTTLFSDAFNRNIAPDGGLGAGWSVAAGAWFTDGRAQSDRDGGDLAIEGVALCADCTVQARLLGFGVREVGLTLRSPSVSSTDRYDVILQGNGNLQIRRVRSGVVTVLAQGPSGLTVLNEQPDTVSLSARGASPVLLVASVNGVTRVSATDTSPAALTGAGYAGLWTSNAGVVFDDFALTAR